MLPKDRIHAVFHHQATDRVPIHHLGFSAQVASAILGREAYVGGGIQQWREAAALWEGEEAHQQFLERSRRDAFALAVALGQDLVRMEYWRMPARPARRLDEHTFLYGDPERQWCVYRFDPDTELFQIVDQHPAPETRDMDWLELRVADAERAAEGYRPTAETFAETRLLIEQYGAERTVRYSGGGMGIPFDEPVWLEAALLRPDLVGRYLDTQARWLERSAPLLAQAGVEYVFGGHDMASDAGPFYSPRVFHELLLPRLERMTAACHRCGLRYLFASDGNLWPVAEDLFGASGLDGYLEIDRTAGMDLGRLRERFPHLVLLGNISSRTLHMGSPEEVAAEARSCLEEARRSGGIIVGLSNYAQPGTPARNLEALIETLDRER
jgi:hypothetical protein